ncbi:MAG TPA: hypothetical protein VFP72_01070 [Kineosporiaceae bacterium]|nr:hypothetical protein [Kineosporiaceae bacterium]
MNGLFKKAGIGSHYSARVSILRFWPVTAATSETSSPAPVDWAQRWRDTPELAAVLPELLALTALPKQPTTKPRHDEAYRAARPVWRHAVLAAVWHHAALTDTAQDTGLAHPDPEQATARTITRIVDVLTARDVPGGPTHNKSGVAVTSTLVQAFLDQTLQAAETADGLTPHQIATVRTAHKTADKKLAGLFTGRTSGRDSRTVWADLATRFVTDITTGAGPQIWTHLHTQLSEQAAPAHDEPSLWVTSDPPQISQDLRRAVTQLLYQDGTGITNVEQTALSYHWPPKAAASGQASSPPVVDWAQHWQDTPELAAVLPELLALTSLRKRPSRKSGQAETTTDPYPAAREAWGRTVIAAVWRHVGLTGLTQQGELTHPDPEHAPTRTAEQVVEVISFRGAPGGPRFNKQGAAVASTLVQAFLDQTLQAAETAAPDLTPHQVTAALTAFETARYAVTRLSQNTSVGRDSPSAWANLATEFVTKVTTSAGPQIWTALDNRLSAPAAGRLPTLTNPAAQVLPRTSTRDHAEAPAQAVTTAPLRASTSMRRGVKRKPGPVAEREDGARAHRIIRHSGPGTERPPVSAAVTATAGHLGSPAPQHSVRHDAPSDTGGARHEHPDAASWPITEEERKRTVRVLYLSGRAAYNPGERRLARYHDKAGNGTPESIEWGGMVALPAWRHDPHLSDMLPTALALSVLTWSAPGGLDPFAALRQEWGDRVLLALWRHVEATTEAPLPPPGPARDRNLAAQVAAAITTQAPTIDGQYHKSGAASVAALARAFIDQTLHAAQAAGPGLIRPEHLARLQDAHRAAWAKLTTFAAPRASRRPVKDLSALITRFVDQVNAADAGKHIWARLGHQFGGAGHSQASASGPVPEQVRPQELAVGEQVRPQELAVGEHQEALRILTESPMEPPARRQAEDMLTRWWVAGSGPAQQEAPAAVPGGFAWSHQWRHGRGSAALASLAALSVLPWPSPHTADGPGLTETRDRLQKALLHLLWNSAGVTDPTPVTPGSAPAPTPARRSADTATGVATELAAAIAAAQLPPSGASYDEAGVHATAALTLALLDQALHAVQAAEPALTPTVHQAHRAAWEAATALLDPTHLNHASPAAWRAAVKYFIAVINRAGPHIWTYLEDHLHGRPPRPAHTDQNSPLPGNPNELDDDWLLQALQDPGYRSTTATPNHQPRTTPLDQAPWLHAMLSGQQHTNSPVPSPEGSPSQGTTAPLPPGPPHTQEAPTSEPPIAH